MYSHRSRRQERNRCPVEGLLKSANKHRKIKLKSGELVGLKSATFLPYNYKNIVP